jgi:hypothetical protein
LLITDFTGTNASELEPDSLVVVNSEHYPAHANPGHSQCSIWPGDNQCTAQKEEKKEGAKGKETETESRRDQVEVCA